MLCLCCLAACQAAAPSQEPGRETDTFPTQPVPSATAPQAASGLSGKVMSASDVSGIPDSPLADQMVLAVPVERADELLGNGAGTLPSERLRFLKASLPQADPALSVTLSGADGGYTLALPPGEYILCLADSESTPPDFPAVTRGCGRTRVQAGEMRQVDLSSGFGEVLLVERP